MPTPTWPFFALIPASILLHLFVSPYTKVEESFNIQAIHDILIHGIPNQNVDQFLTANYDHVSFPGSVPRTFAGALVLSGLSRPFVGLVRDGEQVQLLVRGVLGLLNAAALIAFGRSVQTAFGKSAGVWFALFQASQFHVVYYASRTLPNMFALMFCNAGNLALKSFLGATAAPWHGYKGYRLSLYLLTIAGIVFRSELAILVGTFTIYLFVMRRISITGVIIPAGLGGLIIGLLCTVPLDSFLWQSFPLWPEWTAFYYNTIQGHSADWGVSPWHYYFVNALPRLLLNPVTYILCIPVAVLNVATRQQSLDLLVPLLAFVGLYSFLPHKEWRFIIYAIPGLTGVAGAGASWIWTRRAKSLTYASLSLILVASVITSFAASTAILALSSLNYPGGAALNMLHHDITHPDKPHFNVYFDNLACQTGVTRFLESHRGAGTVLDVLEAQEMLARRVWTYDKTEDPSALLDPMFWAKFDYVLAERPEKVIGSWEVAHVVYGFGGVRVLKPGQASGSLVEDVQGGVAESRHWSDGVSEGWKKLEVWVRQPLLGGYWVEAKMEPKIRILVNQHAM
ncbi:Alg9-like mannosyltransferase family-domain-containing protein [Ampelomyces quisqualis]|uniref:Mannosyltransferase n=1 Tax=Ampelomyces quisqualis TaxID=50730 RepID=A0A6A5QBW9_AMPQU|nr:Alg9-like mannosyltransferase family-domain-containing protein [Ampelomyces quisqualis]